MLHTSFGPHLLRVRPIASDLLSFSRGEGRYNSVRLFILGNAEIEHSLGIGSYRCKMLTSYFVFHTSYFSLHPSSFILHTSSFLSSFEKDHTAKLPTAAPTQSQPTMRSSMLDFHSPQNDAPAKCQYSPRPYCHSRRGQ